MVVDHIAYDIGILAPSLFAMSGAPQALQDLSTWCYNYWFETCASIFDMALSPSFSS
jgi:hypothetical protein